MERINFRQVRDLGATLQDASAFIRGNFIKIIKPTLIVILIPILIGALLMISGMQEFYGNMGRTMQNPESITGPFQMFSGLGALIPGYFLLLISMVLTYIMFYGYIKLYVEGKEEITVADLMPIVKSKTLLLIFSSILLIIMIYIGMILCFFPGIYLGIVFIHFFAIAVIENKGFGESWSRCFYLIKDNWWSCFGLYIVTYLIAIGMMILLYIPMYAIMGINMFNAVDETDPTQMFSVMSNLMSFMIPVYNILGILMALLFAVVSAFRYFSLVEKKEGTGERELIEQL